MNRMGEFFLFHTLAIHKKRMLNYYGMQLCTKMYAEELHFYLQSKKYENTREKVGYMRVLCGGGSISMHVAHVFTKS